MKLQLKVWDLWGLRSISREAEGPPEAFEQGRQGHVSLGRVKLAAGAGDHSEVKAVL